MAMDMKYNMGKLQKIIVPEQNILYFRKDHDEISINITNRCPNACCFCIRDRSTGWNVSNLYLRREPSFDDIKKEINKIFSKKFFKKVKICGYGEPILRIDILPEIIKLIKNISPKSTIQLTTSGWPLYHVKEGKKYMAKCIENGLDSVYLGVHALTQEQYGKKVRPSVDSKIAFSEISKFLKFVSLFKLKITCAFVNLDDLNVSQIKRFVDEIKCEFDIREFEK
jgi:TatD DNase family protein